jgi:hypothetical protein
MIDRISLAWHCLTELDASVRPYKAGQDFPPILKRHVAQVRPALARVNETRFRRAAATKSRFRRCHRSEAHQENDMADDKSKRDFRDRDRVSAGDDYEIEYFAQQNGISADQVRQLIKNKGNDRATLAEAARALRERK